jgi:kumamolisin
VTVRVRPKTTLQSLAVGAVQDDAPPAQRKYLGREEYARDHGADPQDMAKVRDFAQAHHLSVVESDAARRSIVLSGDAKSMSDAFGVTLHDMEHEGGTYRGRTGAITVPIELADVVQGVFGLDDRPQADPHFQPQQPVGVFTARARSVSFTPPALAKLYEFPTGIDGTGQCIGIEVGGGYRPADISTYFAGLGLQLPAVKAVLVDGAHNHPTTASGADGEVMLDIEVAAAVAPKAKIAVYFAPSTSQGFLDAITTAIHDTVNKPSVISISWGSAESNWTGQAMTQFDQAFQAAAAMGVTVCCAAGDSGSGDGVGDGTVHVDFPASSPFALGCGGTRIAASAGKIASEVVWNERRLPRILRLGRLHWLGVAQRHEVAPSARRLIRQAQGRGHATCRHDG